MVTIRVVRIPIVNTCLVKTSTRIGGNKTDLKIVELSICMNFITLALGTSLVIFATKPPEHLVWKTFLLKMKKCVVTTVIQITIHYVPLITKD